MWYWALFVVPERGDLKTAEFHPKLKISQILPFISIRFHRKKTSVNLVNKPLCKVSVISVSWRFTNVSKFVTIWLDQNRRIFVRSMFFIALCVLQSTKTVRIFDNRIPGYIRIGRHFMYDFIKVVLQSGIIRPPPCRHLDSSTLCSVESLFGMSCWWFHRRFDLISVSVYPKKRHFLKCSAVWVSSILFQISFKAAFQTVKCWYADEMYHGLSIFNSSLRISYLDNSVHGIFLIFYTASH